MTDQELINEAVNENYDVTSFIAGAEYYRDHTPSAVAIVEAKNEEVRQLREELKEYHWKTPEEKKPDVGSQILVMLHSGRVAIIDYLTEADKSIIERDCLNWMNIPALLKPIEPEVLEQMHKHLEEIIAEKKVRDLKRKEAKHGTKTTHI